MIHANNKYHYIIFLFVCFYNSIGLSATGKEDWQRHKTLLYRKTLLFGISTHIAICHAQRLQQKHDTLAQRMQAYIDEKKTAEAKANSWKQQYNKIIETHINKETAEKKLSRWIKDLPTDLIGDRETLEMLCHEIVTLAFTQEAHNSSEIIKNIVSYAGQLAPSSFPTHSTIEREPEETETSFQETSDWYTSLITYLRNLYSRFK